MMCMCLAKPNCCAETGIIPITAKLFCISAGISSRVALGPASHQLWIQTSPAAAQLVNGGHGISLKREGEGMPSAFRHRK